MDMTAEKFAEETLKYLVSKVPDMDYHTAAEIAEFVALKAQNYAIDCMIFRDRQWKNEMAKSRARGVSNVREQSKP